MAIQFQLPTIEREMVTIFIETLPSPLLRQGGKKCRLQLHRPSGGGLPRQTTTRIRQEAYAKEEEGKNQCCIGRTHLPTRKGKSPLIPNSNPTKGIKASYGLRKPTTNTLHTSISAANRRKAAVSSRPSQQNTRRTPRMLAPIPMTYTKLFPLLLKEKLLETIPFKPLEPPYPRSYNHNARCD
ncbi:hypothetical protein CR513_50078, partial [Mucuna pruriens]